MNQKTTFEFGKVIFFGRSIDEYVLMFNLDLDELRGKTILDCCAGPAAFAIQAAELGINVVASDPLYGRSPAELRTIVDRDAQLVSERQALTRDCFHPELVPVPVRRQAMEIFLQDYETNNKNGRYVQACLPTLPFLDRSFDLVLCGNFLFLYSEVGTGGIMENSPLDYPFHQLALAEMLRVCKSELRIYPLQGPKVSEHQYLRKLIDEVTSRGFKTALQPVKQRDVIGAEQLLSVSRSDDRLG
jgi:hypothetical protein